MSGSYKVSLSTPFGIQKGILSFIDQDGSLSGFIRSMGSVSRFSGGTFSGNTFQFSGVLRAGFFSFRYKARGTITGNTLTAVAETNSGKFQIKGIRVDSE